MKIIIITQRFNSKDSINLVTFGHKGSEDAKWVDPEIKLSPILGNWWLRRLKSRS